MEKQAQKSPVDEWDEIDLAHDNALAAIKVAAAKSGSSGYTLKLIEPIMVGSNKVYELKFRAPLLGDLLSNTDELQYVLTAKMCDLEPDQLKQLTQDDWLGTQAVLAGFGKRRVAGGPAKSTK